METKSFTQTAIQYLFRAFLFLLPIQTIWIYRTIKLQGAKWQYGTLGFFGSEIILWVGIIFYMIWYLKRRNILSAELEFSWTKDRLFLFTCLLFLLYSFGSILWSVDQNLALQYSLWLVEAVLLISILISGPFNTKKLVAWFTAGGVLQALLAIFQFATQSTFAMEWLGIAAHPIYTGGTAVIEGANIGRWLRAYGGLSHPNMLGGYLSFVIITVISVFSVRDWDFEYKKLIIILVLMILVTGVFVSFSRSAWLVTIVTLLFSSFHVLFHDKGHSQEVVDSVIVSTSLFIILAVVSLPLVQTRLAASSTTELKSISQRAVGLDRAVEILDKNSVLGVGAGNYTAALISKLPNEPGWFYQPVHNAFLLILIEFGVVGVLLLLSIAISWYYFMFYRKEVHPDDVFYLSLIIFAIFILGNLDHYLASSFVGIMILAVVFGLFSRVHIQRALRVETTE